MCFPPCAEYQWWRKREDEHYRWAEATHHRHFHTGKLFLLPAPEAEFLDEIQTKVSRSSLLFTVTSLSWDFYAFKIIQPLAVYTVQLLYTVKEKGGNPDRKPYPFPYGLRNPYRTSSLRTPKIVSRNFIEIVRSWIRLLITAMPFCRRQYDSVRVWNLDIWEMYSNMQWTFCQKPFRSHCFRIMSLLVSVICRVKLFSVQLK
jgi:hypothetical protein